MTTPETDSRAPEDADDLLCLSLAIRAVRKDSRSIDVIASTDAIDSYGEIVEQDFDTAQYETNPVVLYNHNRFDQALPIGSASAVAVKDGKLCATLSFVTADANPLAEQVWQSIQQKSLRAVSVGFKPTNIRYEMRDGKNVPVLSGNVLREISMVPIGANHEALARALGRASHASASLTRGAAAPQEPPMAEAKSGELLALRVDAFLPLTAELGIAASSDDDARGKLKAAAAESLDVRAAIRLAPGASRADVAARIAELSTAAAELPKVLAERDALRAEQEDRDTAERAAHVDAVIAAKPVLADAREALETFAKSDYAKFCKRHPKPANTPRERALTQRMAPQGGTAPEAFEAPARARSHNEQADEIAQKLMAEQPAKYAGDDGYGRALTDASRTLKAAARGERS